MMMGRIAAAVVAACMVTGSAFAQYPVSKPTPIADRTKLAALPDPVPRAGVTELSICVDVNGRATSAKVKGSSGVAELDDAAVAWALAISYKPAIGDNHKPMSFCEFSWPLLWSRMPASEIADVDTQPSIRLPYEPPDYPPSLIRRRLGGNNAASLCIDQAGHVSKAEISEPASEPALDDMLLRWVKELDFAPATRGGAPIAVCGYTIRVGWLPPAR